MIRSIDCSNEKHDLILKAEGKKEKNCVTKNVASTSVIEFKLPLKPRTYEIEVIWEENKNNYTMKLGTDRFSLVLTTE